MHKLLTVHFGEFVIDDDEFEVAFAGGGECGLGVFMAGDGVAGLAQEEALHFAKDGRIFDDEDVGAGGFCGVCGHDRTLAGTLVRGEPAGPHRNCGLELKFCHKDGGPCKPYQTSWASAIRRSARPAM